MVFDYLIKPELFSYITKVEPNMYDLENKGDCHDSS